ncbi:MAG: ribosomal protein S18-alanine N-acetyltransferase [Oscillospiraceae bacterium]
MNFEVVSFENHQSAQIAEIERLCFKNPWSEQSILASFSAGTAFFSAVFENQIIGYIGVQCVADEGYLTNVAVKNEFRRNSVGYSLVNKAVQFSKEQGCKFLSLEVRQSNQNAISLYLSSGFKKVGVRKDFYTNPDEDADIMTIYFNQ